MRWRDLSRPNCALRVLCGYPSVHAIFDSLQSVIYSGAYSLNLQVSRVLLVRAVVLLVLFPAAGFGYQGEKAAQVARWEQQAKRISIVRDDWGIAHVKGKTDADAVFGMEYAQAEDDFNRVETNYLTNLGRLAEADGQEAIWKDLRQRLFIDPQILKNNYASNPPCLRNLMQAWGA